MQAKFCQLLYMSLTLTKYQCNCEQLIQNTNYKQNKKDYANKNNSKVVLLVGLFVQTNCSLVYIGWLVYLSDFCGQGLAGYRGKGDPYLYLLTAQTNCCCLV